MPNLPQFKKLEPYRDAVSAADWNALTAAVAGLCRSLGAAGVFDSAGLHIRPTRPSGRPAFFRVVSNDSGGRYTLRPQLWDEDAREFADAPDADDVSGYEIAGDDTLAVDRIVAVHVLCSLQGQWVGLIESAPTFSLCWGVAESAWSAGAAYLMLHPCDDQHGANPDTGSEIKAYITAPLYGAGGVSHVMAPDGLAVQASDVLAYLPIGGGEGLLVSPPLRLPPGGSQYAVLSKVTGNDYDYAWGPAHFINVTP